MKRRYVWEWMEVDERLESNELAEMTFPIAKATEWSKLSIWNELRTTANCPPRRRRNGLIILRDQQTPSPPRFKCASWGDYQKGTSAMQLVKESSASPFEVFKHCMKLPIPHDSSLRLAKIRNRNRTSRIWAKLGNNYCEFGHDPVT